MTTAAPRITVHHNNQSYGPYALKDINQYLVSGRLHHKDLAWLEGAPDWQPLHTIPGVVVVPPLPAHDAPARDSDIRPSATHDQEPSSDRLILPAFLLAFFLGVFGVHRFYTGRTGSGIAMLLLTITGVGLLITGIWATIDWIMILCGSFRDEQEKLLTKWT